MHAAGLQQIDGTLHRLHHDLFGIVGFETEFHTTLRGSTDIAHGVGDATRGEGSACCQMLFVGNQRVAHLVEDADDGLGLSLCGADGHDESHRRQFGDGDVGDDQEQWGALLAQPLLDILRGHTRCNHDQQLLLRIQHVLDTLQHLLDQPRLHDDTDDVCTLGGQLIVGGHRYALLGKLVDDGLAGVGYGDVLILEILAFDEAFYGGAAHSASAYHCNLAHSVFFSRLMKSSASAFVKQSGGNRRRMFVPAQPVKQCS